MWTFPHQMLKIFFLYLNAFLKELVFFIKSVGAILSFFFFFQLCIVVYRVVFIDNGTLFFLSLRLFASSTPLRPVCRPTLAHNTNFNIVIHIIHIIHKKKYCHTARFQIPDNEESNHLSSLIPYSQIWLCTQILWILFNFNFFFLIFIGLITYKWQCWAYMAFDKKKLFEFFSLSLLS
jgi:hypothetical protein